MSSMKCIVRAHLGSHGLKNLWKFQLFFDKTCSGKCVVFAIGHVNCLISHLQKVHFHQFPMTSLNVIKTHYLQKWCNTAYFVSFLHGNFNVFLAKLCLSQNEAIIRRLLNNHYAPAPIGCGIMQWWLLSVRLTVCPVPDPRSRKEAENWHDRHQRLIECQTALKQKLCV